MGNIWKLLKIEPTEDIRTIKKAYAKEVKNCHQEDEPEKWQELYEAYQKAIAHAQRRERNIQRSFYKVQKEGQDKQLSKQEEHVYSRLFEEIEAEACKKQKYNGIFPEFPADKDYNYDSIMKTFLAKEEIQGYFGDIYFWKALEEYYSAYKAKSVAWARVLGKQMEAIETEKLVLNEQQKVELGEQQQKIWTRCVEDGTFLPKKMPKNPLRVAKIDYAITVILGFGIYGLIFCGGISLIKWILSWLGL